MTTLACSIFDPQSEDGALVGWLLLYNNYAKQYRSADYEIRPACDSARNRSARDIRLFYPRGVVTATHQSKSCSSFVVWICPASQPRSGCGCLKRSFLAESYRGIDCVRPEAKGLSRLSSEKSGLLGGISHSPEAGRIWHDF